MKGGKFPRQARLCRKEDFQRAYRFGTRLQCFPLRVCYLYKEAEGASRLGLSIGKRVGNAVLRNRWKRAIREAFRLHRSGLSVPCDMVISVSWKAVEGDIAKCEHAFIEIVSRIGGGGTGVNDG